MIHKTIFVMTRRRYHSTNSRLVTLPLFLFSSILEHWLHEPLRYTTSTTFPDSTDITATIPSRADHPLLLHEPSKLAPPVTTFSLSSSSEQSSISPTSLNIVLTSKAASFISSSSMVSAAFRIAWVCRDQGFLPTGLGRLTILQNFCAAE